MPNVARNVMTPRHKVGLYASAPPHSYLIVASSCFCKTGDVNINQCIAGKRAGFMLRVTVIMWCSLFLDIYELLVDHAMAW